jgi:2-dehydro-3-deoxygalactonokinase
MLNGVNNAGGRPRVHHAFLDWGTNDCRIWLLDQEGSIAERIESATGIQAVPKGGFENVLTEAVSDWRSTHGPLSILAAGMIGSRNGWVEMPYVPTPSGLADIARATRRVALQSGDVITFFPGLTDPNARPFPDVMRGEETQLAGLGLERDLVAVIPGGHAKWARIAGGRIESFQTFVTGETISCLVAHSFLARPAVRPAQTNIGAFERGLAIALNPDSSAGGLLARLFSLRTGWLAAGLMADEIADCLTGIITGWEFVEARDAGWFVAGDSVVIVGDGDRTDLYRRAAVASGLAPTIASAELGPRGALSILGAAGLS